MKRIKKFFLRILITPDRARRLIARIVSGLLLRAREHEAWDSVKAFPRWLRRLADFIDRYSVAEIPEEQDELVAELVRDAVTDAMVDRLLERVSALDTGTAAVVQETQNNN